MRTKFPCSVGSTAKTARTAISSCSWPSSVKTTSRRIGLRLWKLLALGIERMTRKHWSLFKNVVRAYWVCFFCYSLFRAEYRCTWETQEIMSYRTPDLSTRKSTKNIFWSKTIPPFYIAMITHSAISKTHRRYSMTKLCNVLSSLVERVARSKCFSLALYSSSDGSVKYGSLNSPAYFHVFLNPKLEKVPHYNRCVLEI